MTVASRNEVGTKNYIRTIITNKTRITTYNPFVSQ